MTFKTKHEFIKYVFGVLHIQIRKTQKGSQNINKNTFFYDL